MDRTFWQLIEERAEATPAALFAVDERDRTLDFAGYRDAVLRCAAGLHGMGVRAESPVSWMLPTSLEAMVLCGALSRLGAVQNPILPILREGETRFILEQTAARLLCVPSVFRGFDYAAMARTLAAEIEGLEVLVIDDALPEAPPDALPPTDPAELEESPVRWILYTSGTTSEPKGVLHSDASLIAAFAGVADALQLDASDRHGLVFPIAHVGGPGWLIAGFLTGCAQIAVTAFEPEETTAVLARHGVTQAGAGPAFYLAYLAAQRAAPERKLFPALRALPGGGAPKPPQLHYDVKAALGGAGIVSGYGLTECPALTMNRVGDSDELLAQTEGRPNPPETEVRVMGANGRLAAPNEEGELRVRAPQLFRGYLDPALNAEAFDADGFFRTGDLGRVDERGYVTVTGRLKDVIIRKGENISARQLEDLLYTHPRVRDAAVVGLPDPELGERCCAVVACEGAPLRFDEMCELFAKARIARQKIPEQLEIVDALPRNPAGKVEKQKLRDRFATGSRERATESESRAVRAAGSSRADAAASDALGDHGAIIEVVNRYATALDSRDWSLLDGVFTADAVGDFGGRPVCGRPALRRMVKRMVGSGGPSQHLLADHRISLEGDTAYCVCRVRALSAGTGSRAGLHYELQGEYRDQLVRTPEGWRIRHRTLEIHHEAGNRDVLGS